MSHCSLENQNPNLWLKDDLSINHIVRAAIRRRSLLKTPESKTHKLDFPKNDFSSFISDEILLNILSKNTDKSQRDANCLVSKRWLCVQGRVVRSVKVLDWDFLISGRMFLRFPNLTHVDLLCASVVSGSSALNPSVYIGRELGCIGVSGDEFLCDDGDVVLPVEEVDFGLKVLSSVYPNLRRLVVVNCSELGLLSVAEECVTMQELVLHMCNDSVLIGIAAFSNLQILKIVGVVDGVYKSLVSDRGLIILAQGCKRLVKLELRGCEGGYEGIKAIGECCQMLEELTFCDHRMDDGWLSGISYCENLKTLRFVSCKGIDRNCEVDEILGVCPMLERLHLEKCQLRDKQSVRGLFVVCQNVMEVVFEKCWGLNDAVFFNASLCRRLRFVSIEGCSRLTTQGLETVVLSWKELESLTVISCKNIKDDEVTPMLSALFSDLKDFKWCPGNMSDLSTRLSSSDMGRRGGKFFKRYHQQIIQIRDTGWENLKAATTTSSVVKPNRFDSSTPQWLTRNRS
ncbi:RNI-like superfamily protein [Artemisia annua]|uniref:RNI-like superfamily protein n=1 Tax=Artemisia annua TaxID=35608 RepID=A0A2U1MSZ1_ARTAN|nr:RNI-like superfamily protein [Artemisia annua]